MCVSHSQILLVQHVELETGERFWLPPGGRREPGETLAQAAVREMLEETGIAARIVRRMRLSPGVAPGVSRYAIFLADAERHAAPAPTVDLSAEHYLLGAAWHPISVDNPLGPLDPRYWSFLERLLRALARDRAGSA